MLDDGAHFHRCDFQVHTPRDRQWAGADRISAEERYAYATSLVDSCRERGIDAIAVTDHHDLTFVPYIKRAAADETDADGLALTLEKRLVVYPGIELTLAVPCQAIMILDADFEENRFEAVLTALAITPAPEADAKTAQTERLENVQSLKALREKLDEHPWLRDRYIIFPNVSGEGKSSLLRSGMMAKYKEMPFVGGYVDGSLTKLKDGSISILGGKDKAWGNKRLACIQTSDSRREDHEKLGQHTSWIKWAKPTAEALRQACLAQESRISHDEPELPSVSISSISVSNSQFLGPVDLALNPQYNALIGGRGTGKSTILEYLRWALCDQPPSSTDVDVPQYQQRRNRLIENTLKAFGATVDVTFMVNGVAHLVRRDSVDGRLMIRVADDEFRPCSETEIRTLLPIQAYSQKQLSDVSVRTDELVRFVTAPIRSDLVGLERELAEKAERIRRTYSKRLRRKTLAAEISERTLEARSLEEQAEAMRSSLTGLSDDDRSVIDRSKGWAAADAIIGNWSTTLSSAIERVRELASWSETVTVSPIDPLDAPETALLKSMRDEFDTAIRNMTRTLRALEATLGSASSDVADSSWDKWRVARTTYATAYEQALERSSFQGERMQQLQSIEGRLSSHQRETARLNEELGSLQAAEDAYARDRAAWLEVLDERDGLLDAQCQRLSFSAGGAIRSRVRRYATTTAFSDRLREMLTGSSVRRDKLDGVATAIVDAMDPKSQWIAILADLEALGLFSFERDGAEQRPPSPALTTAGLTSGDLDRIARKITPDEWLSLSLIEIGSEPVFEYRTREGEYIAFSNASAGQQATALLKTLLNEPGPPLLVDQPEEDLDNPVMQEIVEQIWKAKQKRQIIFVSHNANLVVNGDAELVAWCDYRKAGDQSGGKIAGQGAIDVPDVREAIKRIMEGGEAAFKLRREKYGF